MSARIVTLLSCTFHSHSHLAQVESCPLHFTPSTCHPRERSLFTLTLPLSTSFSSCRPCSSSFSSSSFNKKFMENLHNSAKEGVDTYDVLYLFTGYEPKAHDFHELQNSPVPLSYTTPTADHDYDDVTLEEMLYQAVRAHVDHPEREGVSVSLSSSLSD